MAFPQNDLHSFFLPFAEAISRKRSNNLRTYLKCDILRTHCPALLGTEQVIAYSPRMANNNIPQQLHIRIHRFHATLPVAAPTPELQIAALNALVHQLADALASTLINP
jgi:hypothetical protein